MFAYCVSVFQYVMRIDLISRYGTFCFITASLYMLYLIAVSIKKNYLLYLLAKAVNNFLFNDS